MMKFLILSISITFASFSCEKEKKIQRVQFVTQPPAPLSPISAQSRVLKEPLKNRWERCKDIFYDYTLNRNLLLASGVSIFGNLFCLVSDVCELDSPLTRAKIAATVATVATTTVCCIGCVEMCMDCSDECNKGD